mmetsp:Transcript_8186/g.15404  ORF Transcript_8186/g.15404 Transcript_8186/m.15404 type:complete len:672 (+) Transcript_8186:152-2167(+)|eukprot:CAMPEP_0176489482 /NCGR_PEP_ID=MMETSP0200_2-20121128/7312_1 /TAXON_ID=947934 /ORGANISM="Chaetoceros sp., Strain GSL56" /LENGTH=671 /DNA_ID=CAMNT_0017886627 /DNA_START=79 /DNA_END=2094 /DNA_ORIENTATION=-
MDGLDIGSDDHLSIDSTNSNDFHNENSDVESGSIIHEHRLDVHPNIHSLRHIYAIDNVLSRSDLSLSTHDESERNLGDKATYATHRDYFRTEKQRMNHSRAMGAATENINTSYPDNPLNPSLLNVSIDESIETVDTSAESPEVSPNKDRVRSIRFAATNEVRTYTPNPEEFIDDPIDFFNDTPRCGVRSRQFFAASVLPFTYGATSSLTTLYFLYELMFRYESTRNILGLYLVGVYFCRILFSSICRFSPKTFVLLGSVLALLGFVAIFFSQNLQMIGSNNETDESSSTGVTLFIIGSILSNCNETIGATQMFVREQNIQSVKAMASNLKVQYLMAKFARIGSFVGAGFLYHIYGVGAVAIMGAGLVCLQIIFLLAYLAMDVFRVTYDPNNLFGNDYENHAPKCRLNCSLRAARGRRRLFKSAMSKLNRSLFKYYPPNIPPSRLKYFVSFCVFGRALSSVFVWITSTVILVDDFGADFVLVGGACASAAALDFATSWIMLRDSCHRKSMPTQREIFICMGGLLVSSAAITAPNIYSYAVGFWIFAICNSYLRLLLIELQGRSNDATESITLQLVRRFWIAGALYSIPLLYSIHPRLPFALGFSFVLVSLLMLVMSLCCCRNVGPVKELDHDANKRAAREMSRKNRPSTKPERNLSFAERSMLTRLIKGKEV